MLHGRDRECSLLDTLVEDTRAGTSAALVLRGEAGIGKTALLDHVRERAAGMQVLSATGVEAESELPFAALHQLCGPLLDQLEGLPAPQREALSTAFGLSHGGAPDGFLVGLAVLSLLSDTAREQPLICVIDDAHWLDAASAEALLFVARRLHADRLALLFAVRAGARVRRAAVGCGGARPGRRDPRADPGVRRPARAARGGSA